MLRTEPSFCIYNNSDSEDGGYQENDSEDGGDSLGKVEGSFSFGRRKRLIMRLINEEEEEEEGEEAEEIVDSHGNGDIEEYYKRMVAEYPSNSLVLKNYAQILQSKGDLSGAEDYLFRATLADPKDGEIMMLYAKLVWELYNDQERALVYFESAARAAPEDSQVLAAYASFLWEIDDDHVNDRSADTSPIEKSNLETRESSANPPLHLAAGPAVGVSDVSSSMRIIDHAAKGIGMDESLGEHLKKMVDENRGNSLCLRNYAQFLLECEGDLSGAEEYYFRATLADPQDGGILMQYAKLVWNLHRDQDRALSYFEKATRAAPEDSHVLAAYACFLWEIDEQDNSSSEAEARPVHVDSIDLAEECCLLDGETEGYFNGMVEENPSNPLFLKNYAQFLFQSKGDLQGAEEYFSRAIQAGLRDGEVVAQYAQLVWELHHDQEKASSYFEHAVQEAPGNSNVLAAYARFLWDAEEEEE